MRRHDDRDGARAVFEAAIRARTGGRGSLRRARWGARIATAVARGASMAATQRLMAGLCATPRAVGPRGSA